MIEARKAGYMHEEMILMIANTMPLKERVRQTLIPTGKASPFYPHTMTFPEEYPNETFLIMSRIDPFVQTEQDTPKDFRALGWIAGNSTDRTFIIANSQLARLIVDFRDRSTPSATYIQEADIHYAEQYPVLLVHPVTLLNLFEIEQGPAIGKNGLIFHEEKIYRYTLQDLGDAGLRSYKTLSQSVQYFLPGFAHDQSSKEPLEHDEDPRWFYWRQMQEAAKELASLYWQFHQEQLRTAIPRTPPKVPNVLSSGKAPIIAPLAVVGVLGAYSNAQSGARGWKNATAEKPYYQFSQGKDMARIEFRPPAVEIVSPDIALQSLWQQVAKFSDLDGDVFLAMLAQWTAAPREADGSVWITNEQILGYRGIQPRQHENSDGAVQLTDHRLDDLQDIAISIERIRNTHVTTLQWVKEERTPGKRGRSKKRQLELESYIVLIEEFIRQRDLPSPTDLDQAGLPIAWRLKLGNVLEMFFEGPNRQVAWLLQQALSYDYYHEMWEKRLARYCTFHMRINPGHGGVSIIRRVGDMFDELSLPTNESDPEKTRKRFEKALDRLLEDRQISAWSYQEDLEELPSRKWLPIWLEYHIQIAADPLPPIEELP